MKLSIAVLSVLVAIFVFAAIYEHRQAVIHSTPVSNAALLAAGEEIAKRDDRIATLSIAFEGMKKIADARLRDVIAEHKRAEELEARLAFIIEPSQTAQSSRPSQPDASWSYGVTDMSASHRTETVAATYTHDRQQASDPASTEGNETSRADVFKASDFYDAMDVMSRHCSRQWPSNQEMANYCMQKEMAALSTLKKGRPFGADEKKWNAARVSCAAKWPDDYDMRAYCESKGGE
jgi:hypothetical protein